MPRSRARWSKQATGSHRSSTTASRSGATLITEDLVDNFGVSLASVTAYFTLALGATFAAWYASKRTLSIHNVTTTKREAF
tara:strand:+ start:2440 stop:2682 length:243 start_codon:yes stop_codon:yes gene_type:complete